MVAVIAVFIVIVIVLVGVLYAGGVITVPRFDHLTGSRTRIFRGVGVANDADERQLGAGIITSQPLFDYTYTYFDGKEMVSCDECPNPVLCQGCPNVDATAANIAEMQRDEPRGRVGAGRAPIIGTSTRVRGAALEKYSADDDNPIRHLRKCGTHTPATAAGILNVRGCARGSGEIGELSTEPTEYVGMNNYQYIHRQPYL